MHQCIKKNQNFKFVNNEKAFTGHTGKCLNAHKITQLKPFGKQWLNTFLCTRPDTHLSPKRVLETVFTSKGFYFVGVELLDAFCRVSCDRTAGQSADGEERVKHRHYSLLGLHLLKHHLLVHRQRDPHFPQGASDHYWRKKKNLLIHVIQHWYLN